MERVKWVEERLNAWALWIVVGSGGRGGGSMFNPNRVDQTSDVIAGMRNSDPNYNAEVLVTDRAVASLPVDLKRTVIEAHTGEGGVQDIANKLGINRRTLHNRLCNADRRIDAWLDARTKRQSEIRSNLNYATFP